MKSKNFDDPAYADLDPTKETLLYVGRLCSYQKGIDKLPLIMEEALRNGAQFVCIGIEADPQAKEILEKMKKRALELNKKGVLILEDRKVNGKFVYQGVIGSLLRAFCALAVFPSKYEPCGLVQGELNRFMKMVFATLTGGFNDTLKTEGTDANGFLFKRCHDWNSKEQDEEIIKTLKIALDYAKAMMHALHHGDENAQRPFIDHMRTISRNALNSTWEKTPDGFSPHAIHFLELAYAGAFGHRDKRGQIPTNLKTLKV